MSTDPETIWKMFRDSIVVLSLPTEEQRRVNGPGCLVCDLSEEFRHWSTAFLAHFGDTVTPSQQSAILDIITLFNGMDKEDCECWNDAALQRPAWQTVREKSCEALPLFGWEGTTLKPSVEVEPGVWHRPRD
jgi:hypothetical protein